MALWIGLTYKGYRKKRLQLLRTRHCCIWTAVRLLISAQYWTRGAHRVLVRGILKHRLFGMSSRSPLTSCSLNMVPYGCEYMFNGGIRGLPLTRCFPSRGVALDNDAKDMKSSVEKRMVGSENEMNEYAQRNSSIRRERAWIYSFCSSKWEARVLRQGEVEITCLDRTEPQVFSHSFDALLLKGKEGIFLAALLCSRRLYLFHCAIW